MRFDVDMIENADGRRIRHGPNPVTHRLGELLRLRVHGGLRRRIDQATIDQESLQPKYRIPSTPDLHFRRIAIAGRVIRGRVGSHSVGDGFDQGRPATCTGSRQRGPGHCKHRKHIIAIDADTVQAEARRALNKGSTHLPAGWQGYRPLIVLAEEDHRRLRDTGQHEGLVHIALRTRAITEVGHRCRITSCLIVTVGPGRAAVHAIQLDTHRIADRMQDLTADHDHRQGDSTLAWIPSAVGDPPIEREDLQGGHTAHQAGAMVSVGREGEVRAPHRVRGADLSRLLPKARRPKPEFPLTLKRRRLDIQPAGQDHVSIQRSQQGRIAFHREIRMPHDLARGIKDADHRVVDDRGVPTATRPRGGNGVSTHNSFILPLSSDSRVLSCHHGTVAGERVIRVFLLDDHEVVRRGLAELIGLEADMLVVGEAASAKDSLPRLQATRPDVAVLDVRLPDGSGVDVCRDALSAMPGLACLMLTSYSDDEALFDAIMAGASGYVLKDIRGNDLIDAIRQVAAGKSLLDPGATQRVLERLRKPSVPDDTVAGLSEQEQRILDLIGEGLTNRQIGEHLHLAEKTIKNYVSGILAKLGMERRTQAAAFVARRDAVRSTDHGPRH